MSRFDHADSYAAPSPYARRDDHPRYDPAAAAAAVAASSSATAHSPCSSPSSAYPPYDDTDDAPDADDDPHAALTSQTLNADGTPKRPMNAFMIYARRRRPQISAQNQMMRTGDISKILSKEWAAMDMADKKFYLDQAKKLKDAFNAKYPDYVYRRRPNNSRRRRRPDPAASPDDPDSSPTDEDLIAGLQGAAAYAAAGGGSPGTGYHGGGPASPDQPPFPFLPPPHSPASNPHPAHTSPDLRLSPASYSPTTPSASTPYTPSPSSASPGAYAPWDARPDPARWARAPTTPSVGANQHHHHAAGVDHAAFARTWSGGLHGALAGSLAATGTSAYSAATSASFSAPTSASFPATPPPALAPAYFPARAFAGAGLGGGAAGLGEWYRLPALQGQAGGGGHVGMAKEAGWWDARRG